MSVLSAGTSVCRRPRVSDAREESFSKAQRKVLYAVLHQYMLGKGEWLHNFNAFLKKNARVAESFQRVGGKILAKNDLLAELTSFEPFCQLLILANVECFPTLVSIQRIKRRADPNSDCTLRSVAVPGRKPRRISAGPLLEGKEDCRASLAEAEPISMKEYLYHLSQAPKTAHTSRKQATERGKLKTEPPAKPLFAAETIPILELSSSQLNHGGYTFFDFRICFQRAVRAPPPKECFMSAQEPRAEARPTRQVVVRNEPMGDFHSCLDPNYKHKGNFALFKLSDYGRAIYQKSLAVMPLQPFCEERSAELKSELEDIKKTIKDICFTPFSPSVIDHFIKYV